MSLQGKVAFVTGATGTLGKTMTRALLGSGARVVAAYRDKNKLEELVNSLGEEGKSIDGVEADFTVEASVQAATKNIVEKHGRIDILLNIIGAYAGGKTIAETSEQDWDFMMNVNLKSAFLGIKAVLPSMMRQNYGKIVSIGSRAAAEKQRRIKNGAYAISKAGVIVLTETVAEEVKGYDINVNCVLPSTIDTPDNRRNMPKADFSKWVNPEEIAQVILFLVSDTSKVTSGASIPVFGKA